jgi:hypothetical protein
MSQQLLSAVNQLNLAIEALAARVTELERRLDGVEAAADGYIIPPRKGPGRPPKQAAPDGNGK